ALINLIRGEENFGKFSGELSMKESSLKAEISESEAKVKKKRTELEAASKESSSMLDRIRTEVNALAKPVDDYVALGHGKGASAGQESIEDLERAFQDKFSALLFVLKEKLNQAEKNKAKPIKRDFWLSSLPLGDLQGDIERLENATAADFTYLKDLAESVSLYYYNDYMLRIAKKQGFTDSLLGKKLNSEMFRSEKATKEERIRKISQMHPGKISIRDPFEVFIQDKFLTREFDSKLGSLREATLGPLVSLFNLESEEKAYLVKSFSGRDTAAILTSVRDSLTEIINSREGFSSKTDSINNEIDNLIQSQKRMQQQIEFLQKTDNLISNSFDARKKFNAEANAYESGLRTIDEKRKSGNSTVEGMYRTWFGEINPNVLSLLNDDSDLSVLDYDEEGKKEIEKLYNIVQWKYKELVDAHKLGINNLSVGYGSAGTERWSFDKSALVASSPSRWLSQLIDNKGSDFRRYLVKLLDLKGFDSAKVNSHNYTKPWEISLTFFAAASFLDNISPLTTGGGYWEKYEKGRDNILHHALYLHEGKYVVRDRTLLLTDAAEIADLESGDKAQIEEAKRRVMELYTVKDIKEAVGE
ncbi:MAG: hypothetical protein PHP13_02210, partial [Methanomicrobium sp.]|nr:hypothetical protein [Methanomicrobium sp.]